MNLAKIRDSITSIRFPWPQFITNRMPCDTAECRANDHRRTGHGMYGCLCALYDDGGNHTAWCPCTRTYGTGSA